jgi:hypothetical protein
MNKYAHFDANRADGCYVRFDMIVQDDDNNEAPDVNDGGFWPSRDPKAGGYVGDNVTDAEFAEQHARAQARMDAWHNGEWHFVGVRAVARVEIMRNRVGTTYTLESPGLWRIESDADEEYLREVFRAECEMLKADMKRFANATFKD